MASPVLEGKPLVLVVDDDPGQRLILERWLGRAGFAVRLFPDGESALEALDQLLPELALLDLHLPGIDGLELLETIKGRRPDLPAVMLTGEESVDTVVAAMRLGAVEYLVKPSSETRLLTTVRGVLSRRAIQDRVRELEQKAGGWPFPGIIGSSPAMEDLYRRMNRIAGTDVSVLIHGESGTGKELVARGLHGASPRSKGPLVTLNCAAVPPSLQESELFGHEKGAFTGASVRRVGLFEQADGGTLFLDEVAELSPSLQAQLLRILQEKTFRRVGGSTSIASDFRLLTATHRDLSAAVREGSFREDLYYRLAVFELSVPPLRERDEDILLLAEGFARDFGRRYRGEPALLSPEAEGALLRAPWPGNVRELQNAVQRAVLMAPGRELPLSSFPAPVREAARPEPSPQPSPLVPGIRAPLPAPGELEQGAARTPSSSPIPWPVEEMEVLLAGMTLEEVDRLAVAAALRRHKGNRSEAARELGIARSTLYRKLEISSE